MESEGSLTFKRARHWSISWARWIQFCTILLKVISITSQLSEGVWIYLSLKFQLH